MADADLVARSLSGDRDAFGKIVAHYQTLMCSLTYSICGDIQFSEELAQETFLAAWRQLRNLQEPRKLKSWLCGIARNLAHNALRRQRHEPVAYAEALDEELLASSRSPQEDAISREEVAMLWKALEDLPENYREPMILFYREQESIRAVADALDLTEDTVKQRLARGRIMLTQHVEHALRIALRSSVPGKTFTLGVIAALPLVTTSAKAATVIAVTKGGVAKTAGASGGGALAILASFVGLGGYVGYKMGRDAEQSAQHRAWVTDFWRVFVVSVLAFVLPALGVAFFGGLSIPWLHTATIWWLGLFYMAIVVALAAWVWRRRNGPSRDKKSAEPGSHSVRKPLIVWVALAMIAMGALFAWGLSDSIWQSKILTPAELEEIIAGHKDAQFAIDQYQNGSKWLGIKLPEKGSHFRFELPANEATLAILKRNGVTCPTYVQGRDFEVFGAPGRWIGVTAIFVLAAGTVILVRRKSRGQGFPL